MTCSIGILYILAHEFIFSLVCNLFNLELSGYALIIIQSQITSTNISYMMICDWMTT